MPDPSPSHPPAAQHHSPRALSRRRLAAGLWTLLVAALLALPGDEIPDPGPWDWLDKPAHALLFGVHYALLVAAAGRPGQRSRGVAALASGLFALAMEAVQLAVPGRGWEWWDLVAGLAGIAAAGLLRKWRRAKLKVRP